MIFTQYENMVYNILVGNGTLCWQEVGLSREMNNDVFYQCSSSMASFKSMNCCLQVLLVVHFFFVANR